MQVKERKTDSQVPRSISMPPGKQQQLKAQRLPADSFFNHEDSSEDE
jgi:hypothetical protein